MSPKTSTSKASPIESHKKEVSNPNERYKRLNLPDLKNNGLQRNQSNFVAFNGAKLFSENQVGTIPQITEPISRGAITPYGVSDCNKNVLLANKHA